jgi:hypothetical protein
MSHLLPGRRYEIFRRSHFLASVYYLIVNAALTALRASELPISPNISEKSTLSKSSLPIETKSRLLYIGTTDILRAKDVI